MSSLRICVWFEYCDAAFYALAMAARPYSEMLQRIEFMPPNYYLAYDTLAADITVLVPPETYRYWDGIYDDVAGVHMGEQILYMEVMRVCQREGILSMDELYA